MEDARRAAEELTACPPDESHAETAAALMAKAAVAARAIGERAVRKLQRIAGFTASALEEDADREEDVR